MQIMGRRVTHKKYGEGIIVSNDNCHIIVSFSDGEKNFVFPDAFVKFLKATDDDFSTYIENYIEENKKRENEKRAEKETIKICTRSTESKSTTTKYKKLARANIAFKCNFCDGGRSDNQVGFDGVCSDRLINNNIVIEHRTWCNSDDCACLHYINGEISREELELQCNNGGLVCYESQMLRDWKALAGIVQTGERKGEPMKLNQVQRNSLCVLTTRNPGSCESDRYIFGVFLVDETYEGDGKDEGYVTTNSKYKIKLSPKEAESMLFWNYHSNSNNPKVPVWSSGLHRYFQDDVAIQILRDIVEIKIDTADYPLTVEFLERFCKINGINILEIGEPCGALKS